MGSLRTFSLFPHEIGHEIHMLLYIDIKRGASNTYACRRLIFDGECAASYEYPQHAFMENRQIYPSIITKEPPHIISLHIPGQQLALVQGH